MTVEQAAAFLADLPAEGAATEAPATAGAPAGMFKAAMDGGANPDLNEASADADAETNGHGDVALARNFGLGGLRPAERH